jgi:hypothetical protein
MPIPLRSDFDAAQLWLAAKKTKDGPRAPPVVAGGDLRGRASRSEATKMTQNSGAQLMQTQLPITMSKQGKAHSLLTENP